MSVPVTSVVCAGCGYRAPDDEAYPFRCANARAGDDVDHVMTRVLDPARVRFPEGEETNPFVRYRELFHSYHLARSRGLSDRDYVDLVERLDKSVADVDGRGFAVTPFRGSDGLSERLGLDVWVKDETGNVSGSHKARHLMGLMIHLLVAEQGGLAPTGEVPDLAIASCGNAALAAAVVARAAGRRLRVFVPTWADPPVLRRLEELGAEITACARVEGIPGDPAYHALQAAVAEGAVPFTCQGRDNGLTIEGGMTLGYEMVTELAKVGEGLDRLVVQVGGGALASSVFQGFEDAARLGVSMTLPRFDTVQTRGAFPLRRAYDRLTERFGASEVEEALRHARTHRSEFMWPWEQEPRSVATGILDDETYDWAAVVRGMLTTGGSPLVVSEETLVEANDLARGTTGIDVDPTGSAGLAGILDLRRQGAVQVGESVAVLFTGVRR